MSRGIQRKLKIVARNVDREIADNSHGKFGRGLASEGYAGGYRDAIQDVMLALRGVNSGRRFWTGASLDAGPCPEKEGK